MSKPKKSLICRVPMVIPIPQVKPSVTGSVESSTEQSYDEFDDLF